MLTLSRIITIGLVFSHYALATDDGSIHFDGFFASPSPVEYTADEILSAAEKNGPVVSPSLDIGNLYEYNPSANASQTEFSYVFRSTMSDDDVSASKISPYGSGIPAEAFTNPFRTMDLSTTSVGAESNPFGFSVKPGTGIFLRP